MHIASSAGLSNTELQEPPDYCCLAEEAQRMPADIHSAAFYDAACLFLVSWGFFAAVGRFGSARKLFA